MPGGDDQNLRPPFLGPEQPIYPQVAQVVRVYAAAILTTFPPVYPCYAVQWVPPLTFRDREPCYLTEPNSIALGSGYYLARLIGNYSGLPLYATFCCPAGPFSSSSPGH